MRMDQLRVPVVEGGGAAIGQRQPMKTVRTYMDEGPVAEGRVQVRPRSVHGWVARLHVGGAKT